MSAIILDGLDITTSEEEVCEVLGKVGEIDNIEFARNPFTGVILGSAKCTFKGHDTALLAVDSFKEGCVIKEKTVQVSLAAPGVDTQKSTGTPKLTSISSSEEETPPPPLTMNPDYNEFLEKLRKEGYDIKPPPKVNETNSIGKTGRKPMEPQLPTFATLNQPPRLSLFVGDQKPKSGEADFESWKFEVECLQRERGFSKEVLTPLIKRSIRGEAGEMVRHLGVDATVEEILVKLQTLYGTVESGSTLL